VGSGPLLVVVAHYLLRGGAHVAGIYEAAPMRSMWRYAHRMLPHLNFVQQGYRYWQEIKAAGVPFLAGHVIRRAVGGREVTGAVVSRCDGDWRPTGGTELHYDVDTVILGYGFVPSLELSRLAGCEHRYEPTRGACVPVRTGRWRAPCPACSSLATAPALPGSAVALEEATLAGLAVANRLCRVGGRDHSREASRSRGRLTHLAGFRRVMDDLTARPPASTARRGGNDALPVRGGGDVGSARGRA
jgi:hypothetical protein